MKNFAYFGVFLVAACGTVDFSVATDASTDADPIMKTFQTDSGSSKSSSSSGTGSDTGSSTKASSGPGSASSDSGTGSTHSDSSTTSKSSDSGASTDSGSSVTGTGSGSDSSSGTGSDSSSGSGSGSNTGSDSGSSSSSGSGSGSSKQDCQLVTECPAPPACYIAYCEGVCIVGYANAGTVCIPGETDQCFGCGSPDAGGIKTYACDGMGNCVQN